METIGLLVLSLFMALSIIAGIGGGGVITPICMSFFSFGTKHTIAISGFTILACSIVKFIMSLRQKHPHKEAVVIDYGLATVMLPTVLMGSMIGVFVNVILPEFYLQVVLTSLLFILAL